MNSTLHTEPFHFICVDDVYDDLELKLIWKELDFLSSNLEDKLLSEEHTDSALDADNMILKKNRGTFLDAFYSERKYSNILKVNKKIYEPEILKPSNSWFFKNQDYNYHGTLISYYENGSYYRPHLDDGIVTCCTWFWKEPKKFAGGNLHFPEYGIQVEIQNNSAVIFPSKIVHAVEEVKMQKCDIGTGYGRFCMTQFLDYKDEYK